ncbi:hypothetical protein [Sporosarcina sp. A2]|uniref:hypothetical protein n=1 Tax=Sporosarcina sp. A2 TaxID=3393449 RepID=UPI003D78F856
MKLENYKSTDIECAVELKKMIQHQIGTIELCNWTDEVDEAIIRTEDMIRNLELLRKMKMERILDDGTNMLVARLKAQGVNAQAFKFTHKKAD